MKLAPSTQAIREAATLCLAIAAAATTGCSDAGPPEPTLSDWVNQEGMGMVTGTSGRSCAQTCLTAQTLSDCKKAVERERCFEARQEQREAAQRVRDLIR